MAEEEKERLLHPLAQLIEDKFIEARTARLEANIEERMLHALYTYKCIYTPEKLAKIREIGGSEIYLPLVNIKTRALKAWLTDVYFSSEDPPFDLEPTPIPEVPDDLKEQIEAQQQQEVAEAIRSIVMLNEASNGIFDAQSAMLALRKAIENAKQQASQEIYKYCSKLAEQEKRRIQDQFVEGGFYSALDSLLLDVALFPTAIMKACVPRKVKQFNKARDVEEKLIPSFNRVSPFDIYPSPSVSDFSDYVIEVAHYSPSDLLSMKGQEGVFDENIDLIVNTYGDIGYRIGEGYQAERFTLEGKPFQYYSLIDVREFWGTIRGEYLRDFIEGVDDNEYYDVCVWECNGYILRVILNPDPFGQKPYFKTSFIVLPDSFWGLSLVDVLSSLQEGVNALSRAIINNSLLSSGPMVERNVDRVPQYEEAAIIPWKIFDSTGLGYDSSPAYRFYQPNLTAAALVQVLMYYLKLADELSGVPAYAHGDVTVGGAGRTSSGLAMLMNNANRGIKEIVKNIDKGIIEPIVKKQYYFNVIDYYGYNEEVPDLNIRAKGSVFLAEKLSQTQRMIELLNMTNNPVDIQLVGVGGRKYLLDKVFRNFGIQLPDNGELDEMVQSLQSQLQQLAVSQLQPQQQKPNSQAEQSPVTQQAQQQRQQMINLAGAKTGPQA